MANLVILSLDLVTSSPLLETFQKPSNKISFLDKPYVQRLSHDQLKLKAVGNTGQCFLLLLFCLFCLYFNGLSEMWGHKT